MNTKNDEVQNILNMNSKEKYFLILTYLKHIIFPPNNCEWDREGVHQIFVLKCR